MSIIVHFKIQRWYESPEKKEPNKRVKEKKSKNFRWRNCAFLHRPTLTGRININKSVKW